MFVELKCLNLKYGLVQTAQDTIMVDLPEGRELG